MDERLRFVARLLDGEKMAGLCREFGISRKTGYKIYARYKDCGLDGLTDRSRRPYRHANRLPVPIETLIVRLKREYPRWGAPKIRERLRRRYPGLLCPASAAPPTNWPTLSANRLPRPPAASPAGEGRRDRHARPSPPARRRRCLHWRIRLTPCRR